MKDRSIEIAYFGGIAIGIVAAAVVMGLMMRMQTANGWCDNIARDSAESYQVTYDQCMSQVEARRQKGIW